MKYLRIILALILKFLSRPKKEDLQHEYDKLVKQTEDKRQAMRDALDAGFDDYFHVLRKQWLQLCKKRNSAGKRLPKD